MSAALSGIRVVELAGIGPGPHTAMMLADLGAEVVRVVRPVTPEPHAAARKQVLRGRVVVPADLKDPADLAAVLELIDAADVVIEGYRPGVVERLGIGPDVCLGRNPALVFGRMTGWGQSGPMAARAGHDINYISLTGALHAIGPAEHPVPPLNLVGDYGGGSMFLLSGILAALVERSRSGLGQVVDAAMVDGASTLLQGILEMRSEGVWSDERADNLIDGGAPFYRTYACLDGKHMAVGAIEPQFYAELLAGLDLDPAELPNQHDTEGWPAMVKVFGDAFLTRTRDEWAAAFADSDACATPVLDFEEAVGHPHIAARGSLASVADGVIVSGPAPRLSRSVGQPPVTTSRSLSEAVDAWQQATTPERSFMISVDPP